jgi:predicted transcriptional regulator
MKAVTVRLDNEQAERLEKLTEDLHNSEAGVLRFALDLLFKTVAQKTPDAAAMAPIKAA